MLYEQHIIQPSEQISERLNQWLISSIGHRFNLPRLYLYIGIDSIELRHTGLQEPTIFDYL